MTTLVLRLIAPRPDFAMTMSDDEHDLMGRHADHWRSRIEAGQVVVFGPVADGSGSCGLCVADVDDEAELRAFAAEDARRSEERRVGKECRSRWTPKHYK